MTTPATIYTASAKQLPSSGSILPRINDDPVGNQLHGARVCTTPATMAPPSAKHSASSGFSFPRVNRTSVGRSSGGVWVKSRRQSSRRHQCHARRRGFRTKRMVVGKSRNGARIQAIPATISHPSARERSSPGFLRTNTASVSNGRLGARELITPATNNILSARKWASPGSVFPRTKKSRVSKEDPGVRDQSTLGDNSPIASNP